jgi:hypothetical protein
MLRIILIYPHVQVDKTTFDGCFSKNFESMCKDVECTFGILKKLWGALSNGFKYHDIKTCKKVFLLLLAKFLLDLMGFKHHWGLSTRH